MVELSKDVVEYRKRKQEKVEQKMTPGMHKSSIMRNPTSKATLNTKSKMKSKGSIADKSRSTF
jgi:hypothetical protein